MTTKTLFAGDMPVGHLITDAAGELVVAAGTFLPDMARLSVADGLKAAIGADAALALYRHIASSEVTGFLMTTRRGVLSVAVAYRDGSAVDYTI